MEEGSNELQIYGITNIFNMFVGLICKANTPHAIETR
jgi:hypothetical protein